MSKVSRLPRICLRARRSSASVVQIDLATGIVSDLRPTPPNWTIRQESGAARQPIGVAGAELQIQSLHVDDEGLLRVEESGSVRHLVRRSFVDASEVEQATVETDGPVLVTRSEILYGRYDEL